jgi:hypothetical protein
MEILFVTNCLIPEKTSLRDPAELLSPSPDPKMETDPVSETLCSQVSRITDDEQSSGTQRILFLTHYRRNLLESPRILTFLKSVINIWAKFV